jgi:hypothetical protein
VIGGVLVGTRRTAHKGKEGRKDVEEGRMDVKEGWT